MPKGHIFQPNTFLYFAYGANLLTYRARWYVPTAEFLTIARLDNFRLDFSGFCRFWGGPLATIVPTANAHTWGIIWRLHENDLVSLDDQNRVDEKVYFIKYVTVNTPHMGQIRCRTYMRKIYPLPKGNHDPVPVERWPSWSYKQILIMGAKEHGLPEYYIKFLEKVKDNGDIACWLLAVMLKRYANNRPCECTVAGVIPRKPLKYTVNRDKQSTNLGREGKKINKKKH